MPVSLRSRIENSPNLQQVLSNTGWLFADNILRLGVGLFIGVWVARYLGPDQFGLFSYAMAFVSLFGAIASMGLNGIVVRDLVKQPETANITLGTAFVLQLIGGLLAFTLSVIVIGYVRPNDALAKLMVAVLGTALMFKASEVVKYWFESQVQSRYVVWIENSAFIIIAGVKVVLVLQNASLMAFVWIALAEAVLVATGILAVYEKKGGHLSKWKPSIARAKALFRDCWPLILSSLAVMIYLRIDQIMLAEMVDNHSVGIYSAAVRISEIWYFIPMSIVSSLLPSVINAKKESQVSYEQRLQKLYDLMVVLALAIAIPMTFLSNFIVMSLYGKAYLGAGAILSINIWAVVFVFLGTSCGVYANIENLPRYSFFQTLLGMLINISLNFVMIPLWGGKGAAIATVISYAIATFSVLIFSRTRANGFAMLRALNVFKSIRTV